MTFVQATGSVPTPQPRPPAAPATAPAATRTAARAAADHFRTPDWVKDAILYQVFPDRFANGDAGNDPQATVPWGTQPTNDAFMGGDLNGLTQKLGYLAALGVTGLYLNPVFTSPSNHKYNTTDYEHVDPHLGGDRAFGEFVDAAHGKGMKVVLDGVFNHTSHQHGWFQDVRDKGPASLYAGYYDVRRWPIRYTRDKDGVLRSGDYKGWWDYATLPELTTTNPRVREYFLTGKDSIVKRWLRDGKIDGWRMDVADEVEPDFWREARAQVKATNPDAYLLAENWHDATSYLQGDQFDGAMNYRYFQQPAVEFFARKQINADAFVGRLRNDYPSEARYAAFNVLDSHDTPRFITEAGGDWHRLRPAAIFQMTYVGAPVIYYGDEVGMEGGKDPDSRRTFPWELVTPAMAKPLRMGSAGRRAPPAAAAAAAAKATLGGAPETARQLHALYQRLIAIRSSEPTLRRGEFAVLATHNDHRTVAYRRMVAGSERDAIVALNNDVTGHPVQVPMAGVAPDGTAYVDGLSGARHVVRSGRLDLPAIDGNFGAVLLRESAGSGA